MSLPDFTYELNPTLSDRQILGLDEVGRGCIAGPVVAAAAWIPKDWLLDLGWNADGSRPEVLPADWEWLLQIQDSKKLSESKREMLVEKILHSPIRTAWASASPEEIDQINILQASFLAMERAAEKLTDTLSKQILNSHSGLYFLVDGNQVPTFCKNREAAAQINCAQTIVKGDSKSLSIAAASLVAKVARDRWMKELHAQFPVYGLLSHKGYPTAKHWQALKDHGPASIHRKSFNGVT